MIEIFVKIIIVAASATVFGYTFREEWRRLRAREDEYDAFEKHRVERQAEFDQHARAVARAMLMQDYAKVHFVGETWHE